MLPHLRKIISVCESKEIQGRFFFSRETYTRIIVIDLINSELIQSLSCGFSLHINICVLVCDCYFELIIFMIILFETQQFSHTRRLDNSVPHNLTKHTRHVRGLEMLMKNVSSHLLSVDYD